MGRGPVGCHTRWRWPAMGWTEQQSTPQRRSWRASPSAEASLTKHGRAPGCQGMHSGKASRARSPAPLPAAESSLFQAGASASMAACTRPCPSPHPPFAPPSPIQAQTSDTLPGPSQRLLRLVACCLSSGISPSTLTKHEKPKGSAGSLQRKLSEDTRPLPPGSHKPARWPKGRSERF